MSAIDVHVGHRIAARRRASGWSIETLAARTGLPTPRLQAYETGEQRAAADDLLSLSSTFDVGPSYFFEEFSSDHAPLAEHDVGAWPSAWLKK